MNRYIHLLAFLLLAFHLNLPAQTIKDYIDNDWPDDRYQVHGDGTVTDTVTGLMWLQCSLGQTYADGTCSDAVDAAEYTWRAALEAADTYNLGGYSDWRLPDIKELASVAALDRYQPSINSSIFPNTPSRSYWSASPFAYYSDDAWLFGFSRGSINYHSRGINYHIVRLVRSGQ